MSQKITYFCEEVIIKRGIIPVGLEQFADLIILVAAVLVAVTNIWKFFVNSGKGIRKKVTEVSEDKEKDFKDKVDARVKEVVQPMLNQ
jgi:hypothetical protein